MPSGVNHPSESSAVNPVVFKTEEFRFRDMSCNVNEKGNVIRSAPGERGKDGVRQGGIPGKVDERTVQTF
jgi:hypothetical protein